MPTQDETAQAISECERRDELLRQIGEKVVERCDRNGRLGASSRFPDGSVVVCPVCGADYSEAHAPNCEIRNYLEATDE